MNRLTKSIEGARSPWFLHNQSQAVRSDRARYLTSDQEHMVKGLSAWVLYFANLVDFRSNRCLSAENLFRCILHKVSGTTPVFSS